MVNEVPRVPRGAGRGRSQLNSTKRVKLNRERVYMYCPNHTPFLRDQLFFYIIHLASSGCRLTIFFFSEFTQLLYVYFANILIYQVALGIIGIQRLFFGFCFFFCIVFCIVFCSPPIMRHLVTHLQTISRLNSKSTSKDLLILPIVIRMNFYASLI